MNSIYNGYKNPESTVNKRVHCIEFTGSVDDAEFISILSAMPNIRHVSLLGTNLSNAALSFIPCKLESLEIFDHKIDAEDIEKLAAGLAKTKNLVLFGLHLTTSEISALLPAFRSLRSLVINCNFFGNEGAVAIASILPDSSLEKLHLAHNLIEDDGIISLCDSIIANGKRAGSLQRISLEGNYIQAKSTGLKIKEMLESVSLLDFDCARVGGDDAQAILANIAKGVEECPTLVRLGLRDSRIIDQRCANRLLRLIRPHPRLSEIDLDNTSVVSRTIGSMLGARDIQRYLAFSLRGSWAVLVALASARNIPRLGLKSYVRWLDSGLLWFLAQFLEPFRPWMPDP